MSFWNTFVKVWQVRTSINIQESIEEHFRISRKNAQTKLNMPQISNEVTKKNRSWQGKVNKYRKNDS
jgi:hypothetical protein